MKFLNDRIIGPSPCTDCLVNSMCIKGCDKPNTWIRRGMRRICIYKYGVKWGTILSFLSYMIYKTDVWFPFSNAALMGILLVLVFLPFPFIDWYVLDLLRDYADKKRLDEGNIQRLKNCSVYGRVAK